MTSSRIAFLRRAIGPAVFVFLALAVVLSHKTSAQSYNSGQPVWPAYEGWEKNEDGTFNLVFGYMNDNWQEELNVPVGPENSFSPGPADQGQPTHFMPRRNRFMFRVKVPKDFGTKEMVWTLTTQGKAQKAYASLRMDLLIENIDIMSETGGLGAGMSNPTLRGDKAPVVSIQGAKPRAARVGQPVELVALMTDDGVPRARGQVVASAAPAGAAGAGAGRGGVAGVVPGAGAAAGAAGAGAPGPAAAGAAGSGAGAPGAAGATPGGAAPAANAAAVAIAAARGRNPALQPPFRPTPAKQVGLHLAWYVYRGAGKVTFDPRPVKAWEDTRVGANSPWAAYWMPPPIAADNKYTTRVTFDDPGTYVIVARGDDGLLSTDDTITVTVAR